MADAEAVVRREAVLFAIVLGPARMAASTPCSSSLHTEHLHGSVHLHCSDVTDTLAGLIAVFVAAMRDGDWIVKVELLDFLLALTPLPPFPGETTGNVTETTAMAKPLKAQMDAGTAFGATEMLLFWDIPALLTSSMDDPDRLVPRRLLPSTQPIPADYPHCHPPHTR